MCKNNLRKPDSYLKALFEWFEYDLVEGCAMSV